MKKEFFFFLLIAIVIIGILLILFISPFYNYDCLEKIAKDYCTSNNYTLGYYNEYGFDCKGNVNLRTNPKGEPLHFYSLPEEKESCQTKKAWSLK